ncbi:MAG: glutamate racemase [Ferruginibacter sp.]
MPVSPIGVFDSGYGGLTVLRSLVQKMPEYDYLYLGDNARAPYGNRPFEEVYQFTLESVQWLFRQGCPLVILACNTASAKALRTIQQNDLPTIDPAKRVLGVIRPTAEVIGECSASGHVGVLGTVGTVESGSYLIEIAKFFPDLLVTQQACPAWVDLVERNAHRGFEADNPVRQEIDAVFTKDAQIDTLLLACTHYPLLMDKIRQYTPNHVQIIAQGDLVADSLADYLKRHPRIAQLITTDGDRRFCTTGNAVLFETQASAFFGEAVRVNAVSLTTNP